MGMVMSLCEPFNGWLMPQCNKFLYCKLSELKKKKCIQSVCRRREDGEDFQGRLMNIDWRCLVLVFYGERGEQERLDDRRVSPPLVESHHG